MSELKPCPFCGGEAKVNTLKWVGGYTATALCKNEPNTHYLNTWDEDEAKAVERITEAWNTRHVETCRLNELDALTQTLSMVNGCAWSECSECGCLTPDDSTYCINCGRRVEG